MGLAVLFVVAVMAWNGWFSGPAPWNRAPLDLRALQARVTKLETIHRDEAKE